VPPAAPPPECLATPPGLVLGGGWVCVPAAEYDWVLGAREVSRLGDAGTGLGDAVNHPGHGWRVQAMLERGRLALGPWVQGWSLDASDTVPVGRGYTAQEPGNATREAGLGYLAGRNQVRPASVASPCTGWSVGPAGRRLQRCSSNPTPRVVTRGGRAASTPS